LSRCSCSIRTDKTIQVHRFSTCHPHQKPLAGCHCWLVQQCVSVDCTPTTVHRPLPTVPFHPSSLIPHPSSFILHPSSLIPHSSPRALRGESFFMLLPGITRPTIALFHENHIWTKSPKNRPKITENGELLNFHFELFSSVFTPIAPRISRLPNNLHFAPHMVFSKILIPTFPK
jgi:hypothetical protein